MITRHFILVTLCLLGLTSLFAQSSQLDQFKSANTLYEKGEYREAQALYENLLDQALISDDLHYNLANAYFKTNDIALAILHYHKALKINPSHKDAAYNLALANDKTIDKIEDIPELFIYRWWKAIYNIFSADLWAKITVGSLFLSIVCLAVFLFSNTFVMKKSSFYASLVTTGAALVCWFLASKQNNYLQSEEHAIIMTATVNIISAPSDGSSQLFVLHEGTKVKIEDENQNWIKISLPNGNEGWLQKSGIKSI